MEETRKPQDGSANLMLVSHGKSHFLKLRGTQVQFNMTRGAISWAARGSENECHSQQDSRIASMCLSEYTQALHIPTSFTLLNKSGKLLLASCLPRHSSTLPLFFFSLRFLIVNDLYWYPKPPSPALQQLLPASLLLKIYIYIYIHIYVCIHTHTYTYTYICIFRDLPVTLISAHLKQNHLSCQAFSTLSTSHLKEWYHPSHPEN